MENFLVECLKNILIDIAIAWIASVCVSGERGAIGHNSGGWFSLSLFVMSAPEIKAKGTFFRGFK